MHIIFILLLSITYVHASCRPNVCQLVRCAMPKCSVGYRLDMHAGYCGCCPGCVPEVGKYRESYVYWKQEYPMSRIGLTFAVTCSAVIVCLVRWTSFQTNRSTIVDINYTSFRFVSIPILGRFNRTSISRKGNSFCQENLNPLVTMRLLRGIITQEH